MKVEYKITNKFNEERLNEIIKVERDKGLTAETLIESAKDKNSPLHDIFETGVFIIHNTELT